MKRLSAFFSLILIGFSFPSFAQYSENFTTTAVGALPAGWTVSPNTDVANYATPLAGCGVTNKGLTTPGVGKTAPVNMILPAQTFNLASPNITFTFRLYVFDANLNCNTMKALPCVTTANVYLVPASYNDINNDPTGANILAAKPAYEIENENGLNQVTFNNLALPTGTSYRVMLSFKTADNSCSGGGTRFVLDDFSISSSECPSNNCVPVANDDFFDSDFQSYNNQVKGRLFGGNVAWNDAAPADYPLTSLDKAPAVNGGTDFDNNDPALSTMTYSLVSGPTVFASFNCPGTPPAGTLILNSNGTFDYTRTNGCVYKVSFTYRITDANGNVSNTATVTIELPAPVGAPLPVTFTSFKATRNRQTVALSWVTSSEANNAGFSVQRKNGGEAWSEIAFVPSAVLNGSSSLAQAYQYNDQNNFSGIAQYRLVQKDLNSKLSYSDVRVVKGEGQSTGTISIFPNPATNGSFTVALDGEAAYALYVLDATGRTVSKFTDVKSAKTISGLKPGQYLVIAENMLSGDRATQKIIVQ